MTKFRKGDVVTMTGVVSAVWVKDNEVNVRAEGTGRIITLRPESLKLKKAAIDVGDRVSYDELSPIHTVKAIHEDWLWIYAPGERPKSALRHELIRIDEPE